VPRQDTRASGPARCLICSVKFNTKELTNPEDEIEHPRRSLDESTRCYRDAPALSPRGQMSRFEPLHTLALSLKLVPFRRTRERFDDSLLVRGPHGKYGIASH
jgi:hypothetical protein